MSLSNESFEALLARAKADAGTPNNAALGELLERFKSVLTARANKYVKGNLRAKCDAADLVQETDQAVVKGIATFNGSSEEEFKSWLTRILVCKILRLWRRFRATGKRAIGLETPLTEKVAEGLTVGEEKAAERCGDREEQVEMIREAFSHLSEKDQQVLTLRIIDRKSHNDIASLMGRPEEAEAVRFLCYRSLRHLAKEMRSLGLRCGRDH